MVVVVVVVVIVPDAGLFIHVKNLENIRRSRQNT